MCFFILNILRQNAALLPSAGEEIDDTGNGVSVGRKAVAEDKAKKSHFKIDAKQPAEADSKDNAVKKGKDHAELGVADTLNKGAASAHDSEGREHPQDGSNKLARHFMNQRIVGKEHKQLFAEGYIKDHKHRSKDDGEHAGVPNHLLGTVGLGGADVLADHRHGGVLDALRDLIDNIVDTDANAKGCRGNHANIIDHGIDHQHRQIDAAHLDGHRRAEACDHADILGARDKALLFEVKAKHLALAE